MIDLLSYAQSPTETLPPAEAPADARELLSRFAVTGEQEPFEEVVRRYGGMVYNLCYEVTGNRHDAEDAVQAAFMSLALQVRGGQQIQAIGPWLQQVARRMSLDINRSRKRRKKREEKHGEAWEARMTDARADGAGGAGLHGNPASAAGWEELRHIVQGELNEMPAKYRMPLILHYYGGLSRDEMARELNCKTNTLGVRLHRGREMLAKRLAKRGITLSGVMLGLIMGEVVHSVVSQRLIEHTAQAAVLVSSGHPFACGVVSPQIVAMAHSAGRALASAKVRLATTMALLAGGAAAAGAQVVSRTGTWGVPAVNNWDLSRAFRWLFHPPSFPQLHADGTAKPTVVPNGPGVPNRAVASDDPNAPLVRPPLPMPEFPPRPYKSTDLTLVPFSLPGNSAVPQGLNYPPVPWGGQREPALPVVPDSRTFTINRGFGPVNAGGQDVAGADGSGNTDVASNRRERQPAPIPVPVPPSLQTQVEVAAGGGGTSVPATDKAPVPSPVNPAPPKPIEITTGPGKNGSQQVVPPSTGGGGGGIKAPSNNGNSNSPSPNAPKSSPQATPNTFDPGEVVTQPPTPLPGNPKGVPLEPPSAGPLPPLPPTPQQPTPPPGTPTGDAEGTGNPTPATPQPTDPGTSADPTSSGPTSRAQGGFLSDTGDLYVTNPFNPAGPETFDQVLAAGPGNANFQIGAGATLVSKQVLVGHLGSGVAAQTGGLHTVDSLYVGVMKTGRGLYQMTGGELRVTASPTAPDAPVHSIEIGGAGEGTFLLGDANSTGTITQTADGAGVNLTVGVTRSGKGTLRGWGQVQLGGTLTNNGRVVADGYGQDRSLDLTTLTAVTNARANTTAGNGWYAFNHGKLELPALPVTALTPVATWGQGADSTSLTYVNSARLSFKDVKTDGLVKVALLALDRTDVPTLPQGHQFIGVWSLDTGDLAASGGMDLQVRYDDALAAEKGLDENLLKIWRYVDGQWERLDHDPTFLRDPLTHTLSVHTGFEGVSYFAVSAPEPGTVGLVMVVGAVGLVTRGRRKR